MVVAYVASAVYFGTVNPYEFFTIKYGDFILLGGGLKGGFIGIDESRTRAPIFVNSRRYSEGLTLGIGTSLSIRARRPMARLHGLCGVVDGSCSKNVSAFCQINIGREIIYQSEPIESGSEPISFSVDIPKQSDVILSILPLQTSDDCDEGAWLNLALD